MHRCSYLIFASFLACVSHICIADEPALARSFLNKHCLDCHSGNESEAGLDLTTLSGDLTSDEFEMWVKVHDRVLAGEMPPADAAIVPRKEAQAFTATTSTWLVDHEGEQQRKLGRVRGRRLTNLQVERTLQDLLGIDIPLAALMPEEPRTLGFTTVAAGQSISHFQLQTHLAVVDAALEEAFRRATGKPDEWKKTFSAKEVARVRQQRRCREPEMLNGKAVVWSSKLIFYGRLPVTTAKHDGWYRMKVTAAALNKPEKTGVWCTARTGFCVSGAPMMAWSGAFEAVNKPLEWTFDAWLPAGQMFEVRPDDATLKMARFSGGQVGAGEGEPQKVPGVAISGIELQRIHKGPNNATIRRRLFGDLKLKSGKQPSLVSTVPRKDAARLVKAFAERAFRRPVTPDEVAPYAQMVVDGLNQKRPFMQALRSGYRAILCSPRFLHFRETPGTLDDYALASRISYMLWSTMPDDALLSQAAKGKLQDSKIARAEVARMLKDPRGSNFIKDLAYEWLELSEIDFTEPDRRLYPGFDVIVQESMLEETHRFLQNMLDKNLSVSHLIDSNFTFLNSRLARYYGIDRVNGDFFREVRLRPEDHRGGLMTQGAIMKVTANGTTTSPVLRGIWVSERLLGVDIPPPPATVSAIEPDIRGAKSFREMLEKHKSDTSCASCHVKIDPPGFALENFDPSGRWRERYPAIVKNRRARGPVVEAHFEMADGRPFADLGEFKKLVLTDKAALADNVVRKLLTFGTGATCSFADREAVQKIVRQSESANYGMRTLLQNLIASQVFRTK